MTRWLRRFSFVAVSCTGLGWAQSEGVQALRPKEAFDVLRKLNETKKLLPGTYAKLSDYYKDLRLENCFGVKLAGGARVAGESAGRDYGMFAVHEKVMAPQLGFLYSEAPFKVEEKALEKGTYMVFALAEVLMINGGASVTIPLQSKTDVAIGKGKNPRRPKFSLVIENGQAFLVVGENKLALKPN